MIDLWARLGRGPNLFKETEDLVLSCELVTPEAREDLITRLLKEKEHLESWLIMAGQYQYGPSYTGWRGLTHGIAALLQNSKIGKASPEPPITWRVLQGTYLLCCLSKMRMLSALSPSRFPELEPLCQALAREVMSGTEDSTNSEGERLIGGLFMSEVVWMARAVVETRESWSESLTDASESTQKDTGMIEKWKFEAWSRAIGVRDWRAAT